MCGIAGLIAISEHELASIPLGHRGPDARGAETFTAASGARSTLIHTRLAIVDLSDHGNQPIHNEDGNLALVFNGEIYNHLDLRRRLGALGHRFHSQMDGEVILHLYEEYGVDGFRMLNGIYAFAILDVRSGEAVLARDPVGVKPLYYTAGADGGLVFASEPSAVVELARLSGETDTEEVARFLTFLWIPSPGSPYAGVKSLRPGHTLQRVDGTWREAPFELLRPTAADAVSRPDETAVRLLTEEIQAAVERQLMADVPVGAMASGGIDSSVIWAAGRKGLARCFTIDWNSGADYAERLDEDTTAVRRLEALFGTPVSYLPGAATSPIPDLLSGDLFADPAVELAKLIAAGARAEHIKVLLSGQGGDELFGGYRRHQIARLVGAARIGALGNLAAKALQRSGSSNNRVEYAARLSRSLSRKHPLDGYLELCSYSTGVDRARALGCYEREVSDEVVWARHHETFAQLDPKLSFLRRVMALDLALYLPGLGLAYCDRAGMHHGVEIRVPLLDLELVRFSFTLTDRQLVGFPKPQSKPMLRAVASSCLPAEVVDRPKRGFGAPMESLPAGDKGSRGFRQNQYFALALEALDLWRRRYGSAGAGAMATSGTGAAERDDAASR